MELGQAQIGFAGCHFRIGWTGGHEWRCVRIGAYEIIALPPATNTMRYDDDDTNDYFNLPSYIDAR